MVSKVKRVLMYKIHFSKPVLRKSVPFEQSEYEIYDVQGNSTENILPINLVFGNVDVNYQIWSLFFTQSNYKVHVKEMMTDQSYSTECQNYMVFLQQQKIYFFYARTLMSKSTPMFSIVCFQFT